MTVENKKIDLLIRELNVITKEGKADENSRLMRENLRRIKGFLDTLSADIDQVITTTQTIITNPDISAFTRYDQQVCTSNGQTGFTLADTPDEPDKVRMLVNSCELINGLHFTVAGTAVTFIPAVAGFELEINNELGFADRILFQYIVV